MLSIGVVARQTGIEIGTLRKWEERYGFPRPVRLESGQRRYLNRDVESLLAVARRLATGERVGRVIREISQAVNSSKAILDAKSDAKQELEIIERALGALIRHDAPALRSIMEEARSGRSMAEFVEEFAGPLTRLVGEYWACGVLPIYGEHLYSAELDDFLMRETPRSKGAADRPSVLLSTPAGEQHTLGLSMVNAVLGEAGVASVCLHGGLPVSEISAAVDAYQLKAVGVSATCLYPPKMLAALMKALRNALSPKVGLWFGGAGVKQVCHVPPGVMTFASMHEIRDVCESLDLSVSQDSETKKATQ
jgi:DNA-binding transcriptional MerR regulator/methylmalonyl-CoA mutase cobalamin-binding subunit